MRSVYGLTNKLPVWPIRVLLEDSPYINGFSIKSRSLLDQANGTSEANCLTDLDIVGYLRELIEGLVS